MKLTAEERMKFIAWCNHHITSYEPILKMLSSASPELAKAKRTEQMACAIVAKVLESTETMEIA